MLLCYTGGIGIGTYQIDLTAIGEDVRILQLVIASVYRNLFVGPRDFVPPGRVRTRLSCQSTRSSEFWVPQEGIKRVLMSENSF